MEAAESWSARSSTQNQTDSWRSLCELSLTKFLNHDSRPTFILDLGIDAKDDQLPSYPTYINPALCKIGALFDIIGGRDNESQEASGFLAWTRQSSSRECSVTSQFGGYIWEQITVDERWRIIIANKLSHLHVPTVNLSSTNASSPTPSDFLLSIEQLQEGINSSSPKPFDQAILPVDDRRIERSSAAQDFFWHDSLAQEVNVHTKDNLSSNPFDQGDKLHRVCSDSCENNTRHSYDARIAKRNADLLAKIAAFEKVAIYMVDMKGEIVFCSDAWYEICDHPRDQINASTWTNIFEDDEIPRMVDVWRRAAVNQEAVRYEVRLKRRWNPPVTYASRPKDFPTWISGWTYPDISPTGETIGACGVMTEISEQKWTEHLMEQRLTDAIERAELMEQLSTHARQVAESDSRFRRLSDLMPIGVWMSDAVGNVIYSNDAYRDIIPGSRDASKTEPWWEMVPHEHLARLQEFNRQLLEDHTSITFEVPLKRFDNKSNMITDDLRWVLISTYPEVRQDGSVAYLTGCVTDITHLKVAEEIQGARAADALESKRQLEQFIDMTSHEMRNPLSAIVHSAEEILSTLNENDNGVQSLPHEIATDAIEAAETIIYCAEHSTRIVDDILLVSKLESGLLDLCPTAVQPIKAVKQAWNMFSREMKAFDIVPTFIVDDSFKTLGIDWVYLDMTRVLQVFVNLITNAIKFTRSEKSRRITTSMKASTQRPSSTAQDNGVHYLDSQTDLTEVKDDDDVVYLSFTVQDTGCGMSDAEQGNLFQRFSQAGKRTHVKYGGTGLGLFISRKLCEMQNGQIGLRSKPQEGSVFSFYVMTSRSPPPDPECVENEHIKVTPAMKSAADFEPSIIEQANSPINDKSLDASLPMRPAPRVVNGTDESQSLTSKPSPSSTAQFRNDDASHESTSAPLTILLVEDNLINQKVVAKKLMKQGYTVLVANHGLEAIDCVRKSALWAGASPDTKAISLILLDLEMPVMDGLACVRYIRESEKQGEVCCHIPVIAVTANARQEQINQAKEAGMDDVVTKPFRMDQLTTVMARLTKQFPTTVLT